MFFFIFLEILIILPISESLFKEEDLETRYLK
jgi:hypothetical protein